MKKKILILFAFLATIFFLLNHFYKKDKNKFEPKLWIGLLDYRLNFRDVGESLNQCLKKKVFHTHLVYRSNRYFSGWSCDKIQNPDKIYSLNFSPWNPHAYYCEKKDGSRLIGFHPNTTFEISNIEDLTNWQRPEFKETMCVFFKDALNDLIYHKSFLYHCDIGRDRTGAFTALLTMLLAEQKKFPKNTIIDGIECDYEKTSALEKEKVGRMRNFLREMEAKGGVSLFIEKQCSIAKPIFQTAADNFFQ